MKIKSIYIQNWRSIKELNANLSGLTAFVGKNNNGKSNILSSILFFFGEISKISALDFNDKSQEIVVELTFHELDERDKQQFKKYISPNDELVVKKTGSTDLEVEYRGYVIMPADESLREENLGNYSTRLLAEGLPFYDTLPASGKITKEQLRLGLENYIAANKETILFERRLEATQFMGTKNIAQGMFGEILHIQPVSSAPDELNTKGSTAFNKLYQKLADKVTASSPVYLEAQRAMKALVHSLNRNAEDGSENVSRPEGLNRLEAVVTEYLQSWQTSLQIEFDLTSIDDSIKLNTSVWVDDGIKTDISRKGNGLQRSLIFALIKSWAKILKDEQAQLEANAVEGELFKRGASNSHFFIFEEPELFLHPHAQRELFASLKELGADNNQVFLTTHSSSFLRLEDYKSIISVCKNNLTEGTTIVQCNEELFNTLEEKQKFNLNQWICPNRGELFFASKVILVEGSTEETVIPILAKQLGVYNYGYSLINCGSKTTIPSYIKLLNSFKVRYIVVYDFDHQEGKGEQAKDVADRDSGRIESLIDPSLGNAVVFINDIEEELGAARNSVDGKPYFALKHISEESFSIPLPISEKIRLIYAAMPTPALVLSIDEPGATDVLDTLDLTVQPN